MYSRKFTEDSSLEAPKEWKKKMKELIISEAKLGVEGYPRWLLPGFAGNDNLFQEKIEKKFYSFINLHLKGLLTPCYVSAAIVRGWEVHDSLETFVPVYDGKQDEMARELVLFFIKSKFKILAPGIEQSFSSEGSSLTRSQFGDETEYRRH